MKIRTALILCAGYGKRLQPITNDTPKPLLNVKNINLLDNTLNFVKSLGINKIKINTFYLGEQIKNFIEKKIILYISILLMMEKKYWIRVVGYIILLKILRKKISLH